MPVKPQILNQRQAARSRLFYVEELELCFSNGEERTFERLRTGSRQAVIIVPMLDEETVLLIREYSAGVLDYQLSLPKGLADAGEDVLQGANRELMEEVGYGAQRLDIIRDMTLSPCYMEHNITVVLARDLYAKRLQGDEPEVMEVVAYPLKNIHQLVMQPDFSEGRVIAALYLARDYMQGKLETVNPADR
jgi:ADP-ribose diphosphatase